jgi:hypothetical protein
MMVFISLILRWVFAIVIIFGGFFVMDNKNRTWYHYAGIIGHFLFIIWIIFLIQHYPKDILTIGVCLSLFAALAGSVFALTKKIIRPTLRAGIRLSLYFIIILMVSNYSFGRRNRSSTPTLFYQTKDSIKIITGY